MKTTVRIGENFQRVSVGDCDEDTKFRIVRHIEACPECQRMIAARVQRKGAQ